MNPLADMQKSMKQQRMKLLAFRKRFFVLFLAWTLFAALFFGAVTNGSAVHAEASFPDARPSRDGWLSTSGTYIVNENQEPVILRGISTHGLTWFPDYINESLFQDVSKNWNCNLIRLPMYTTIYVRNHTESWDLMIKGIDAAIASDMYVLADWHILEDYDPNMNIREAEQFFDQLSLKYAYCPNVIYEICNEPNGPATWNDVKTYAETIIPVIRKNSPNALIIVGSPEYDQDLEHPLSNPLPFDNVMYTFHFYTASHYGSMQNMLKYAIDNGLPVFITECGLSEANGDGDVDFENAVPWFDYLHAHGISYVIWNLSNKDETSSFIKATCSHTESLEDADLTPVGSWVKQLLRGTDPGEIRTADPVQRYSFIDFFIIQFNALGSKGLKPIHSWTGFALFCAFLLFLNNVTNLWMRFHKKARVYYTYDDIQEERMKQSEESIRKNRINRFVIQLSAFFTMMYLCWRVICTIPARSNWLGLLFNVALLVVEIFGFVESSTHYRNMLHTLEHPLPKIKEEEYPEVDIFIATYNEPTQLLRRTVNGCKHLKYPDPSKVHIWICDDNRRSEMRELAESMGVGYFDRPDNKGAKAGNLNHALGLTSAPYIVTLDADMIVRSCFLMKTIPYFIEVENACRDLPEDQKVHLGLLQTPQSFYDPDVFQYALYSEHHIPNEQDFFYRTIEVGKTSTNSVIYGGSNTVLSRRALEEIGGFYTESITEDFATGMLIEAAGYLSLALSEPLASGRTPHTYKEHIQQRTRWGRGVIDTARKLKLHTRKGLTFDQRMSYWTSVTYWYSPIKHLIYMLSPLIFAVLHVQVFKCSWLDLLVYWLPMFVMQDFCLRTVSGNALSVKWSGIYENSVMPHLLVPILKESLGISQTAFMVTDKTKTRIRRPDLKDKAPFILLLILSVIGIVRLCIDMTHGGYLPTSILLFWIIRNMYYLIMALFLIDGRNSDSEPVRVKDAEMIRVVREQDKRVFEGITVMLTEHSVKVLLDDSGDLRIGDRLKIQISTADAKADLGGVVIERIASRYNDQLVHTLEILDFGEDELEYLQILYDRVPTLPQSLARDIPFLSGLWRNIIRHADSSLS